MSTPAIDAKKSRRLGRLRRWFAKWPLPIYRLHLGFLIAPRVLILVTTGRKSGRARKTALWYIWRRGMIYCLSRRSFSSEWVRNLEANPSALLQVGSKTWQTRAMLIQASSDREAMARMFAVKYGRLAGLLFRPDRLTLVGFPVREKE